jgi:hypothetical protein
MSDALPEQVRPHEELERAVAISRDLVAAAGSGDSVAVVALDRERRKLLESVAASGNSLDTVASQLLQEVVALNNQSIGAMEHQRRIMQRQLDGVLIGRRAVNAYGDNRRYR